MAAFLLISASVYVFADAYVYIYAAENEELTQQIKPPEEKVHGVWLSYGDYSKLGLSVLAGEGDYRDAAAMFLSDMVDYKINTVFLHMRAFDDAFWKSSTFHASRYIGGDEALTAEEAYPFDPAGIFLEEAHKLGISVHAWLNPYRVSQAYYYDPAEDASIDRVLTAVTELMEFEYNGQTFDGIHLDDYFYHAASGYISVADPSHAHSVTSSPEERRGNVNRMVRRIYEKVHAYGKKFGISPAGNYENCMNAGADIDTWLYEEGYIDYLVPQIYWTDQYGSDGGTEKFTETIELFLAKRWNRVRIYAGLALYRGGSSIGGDSGWQSSSTNIRDQVQATDVNGCDGYVLYCASSFYEPVVAEELYNYLYRSGAVW
ncbi:MAG: family 10 glycosylhydrolase [Blautia sp.]|nr:family 10 glycosylhydrolase [Blautia sp.]